MKTNTIFVATAAALGLAACDVDKTADGEMPSVDVDVDGGKMPEYDVETADVEMGEKEVTMEVPDVDVSLEEETMTVPDVDIVMPDDKSKKE